jgi:2',3'-cyclic-nucleotide 2'-phosphodiesterase (5'-nucleotidase family)
MKYNLWLFLTVILTTACSKQIYLAEVRPGTVRIDKTSQTVDPSISALIVPYKMQLDSTMNKVVVYFDDELVKNKPNSSLGNWFADAMFEKAYSIDNKVDFAFQNYGGLRIPSVAAGPVTVGKLYELMPFDNTLFIMEMPGSILQQLLDRIADYGGWPVSKNISFVAEYGKAKSIIIKDSEFSPDSVYRVALPDYVAQGGDNCAFLTELKALDTGILIRDLIIENLEKLNSQGIRLKADHSIRIKD